MSSRFHMKSKATKEAAKKAAEKGGGFSGFKMTGRSCRLLILPPSKEDIPALFTSVVHEQWANGRPVAKVASPAFDGNPDKIKNMGWEIKNTYDKSSNKKKKDFFKKFLPKESHYVNVLDLDDVEAGPQVYQMSGAVAEVVIDKINDLIREADGDLSEICDFDEGRILRVRHNGKPKLQKRYKAEFLTDTANLLEDGILDDESLDEIANALYDLTKQQPKYDEDAYESYFEKLLKLADKAGIDVDAAGSSDDEEEAEDEFEEDGFDDGEGEEDLDVGDDGDEFEAEDEFEEEATEDEDGFEFEEEEPAPKKRAKKVTKKKVSKSKGTVRKKKARRK